ncbi:MAG: bifunctional oligoribonuclease/PAP phosphatase NrnA [Lachnospiraceae bacterium]
MLHIEEIINCLEKKHVYIQTHNFPDPDAVSSAYGMHELLKKYGIDSTICYKGKIDRYSMVRLIDYLDVNIVNLDMLSSIEVTDEIILVDSQQGNVNLVDLAGDKVISIDHHPTFEKVDYRYSDIRPEVGACASIVASYFVEAGIPVDEKTATALMYGIKIDTANLSRGVSQLDLDMFYKLYWSANQDMLNKMGRSEIQFNDLRAYANAIRNIKIFDNISIAHTGEDCPESLIASISDFMLSLSEVDCSIVYSLRQDGIKLSVRSCDPNIDSGKIANLALRGIGSGGGHQSMAGGFVPFPPELDNIERFIHAMEERFMEEILKTSK